MSYLPLSGFNLHIRIKEIEKEGRRKRKADRLLSYMLSFADQ